MAGGVPGNMHPAQVAEAIRQMRGDSASVEFRPGIDVEPPPGWQPPPLPPELEREIAMGGGVVDPELAAPSGAGQEPEPGDPRRLDVRMVPEGGEIRVRAPIRPGRVIPVQGDPAACEPPREWPSDLGLQGIRVVPGENALVLITDDGELRLNEAEAARILDVCVVAVTRGLMARLDALRARVQPAPKVSD